MQTGRADLAATLEVRPVRALLATPEIYRSQMVLHVAVRYQVLQVRVLELTRGELVKIKHVH